MKTANPLSAAFRLGSLCSAALGSALPARNRGGRRLPRWAGGWFCSVAALWFIGTSIVSAADARLTQVSSPDVVPLRKVAIGDFNRDSHRDVVVIPAEPFSRTAEGSVWSLLIFSGSGDGQLVSTGSVTFNRVPNDLKPLRPVVSDLNGDGRADVVIVFQDECANHVADPNPDCLGPNHTFFVVLLGQLNGNFQTLLPRDLGVAATDVAIADFNNDGRPDLVVSTWSSVSVLLGNGNGTFGGSSALPALAGGTTYRIAVGEFNGDNAVDIVGVQEGRVLVFLGRGDGTFTNPLILAGASAQVGDLAVGDMNDDGYDDIVLSSWRFEAQGFISVILGRMFSTTSYLLPLHDEIYIVRGENLELLDLNDDGAPEVLLQTWDARRRRHWGSIFMNNGNGTLSSPSETDLGPFARFAGYDYTATADFNSDGRQDVVVISDQTPYLSTLLNRPPDVSVTKRSDKNFRAGEEGTYTITVRNVGAGATTSAGVKVVDELPRYVTFLSAAGTGWQCALAGRTLTCLGPRLLPGASSTLTVRVRVGNEMVDTIRNTATVSADGEANLANNTSSVATPFLGYDLAITKNHSGSITVGTKTDYELIVRNVGGLPIDGTKNPLFVTDVLPPGLTFVGGPGCVATENRVTCDISRALAPGETYLIPLTVSVGFAVYPEVRNTAEIHFQADGNPNNNTATHRSPVDLEATLALNLLILDVSALSIIYGELMELQDLAKTAQRAFDAGSTEQALDWLTKFDQALLSGKLSAKDAAYLSAAAKLTSKALLTPALWIQRHAPGFLTLSWHGPSGTVVQTSRTLGKDKDWKVLETKLGQTSATIPSEGEALFFRLHVP